MFRPFFQLCAVLCCVLYVGLAHAGGWVTRSADGDAAIPKSALDSAFMLQSTSDMALCRVTKGRGKYPGWTTKTEHSCHYLYNPCVVGCDVSQGSDKDRNQCISRCEATKDIGDSNTYEVYVMVAGEDQDQWAEASFGEVPTDAWSVGYDAHDREQYICRVTFGGTMHFGVVRSVSHKGRVVKQGMCDTFDAVAAKDTRDFYHYEVLMKSPDRYAHIWF